MEQYYLSTNKMTDERVLFDRIWKHSGTKDCSISVSTRTTAYFIKEDVERLKSKWYGDFPITVKPRKEQIVSFSQNISSGMEHSIWFQVFLQASYKWKAPIVYVIYLFIFLEQESKTDLNTGE